MDQQRRQNDAPGLDAPEDPLTIPTPWPALEPHLHLRTNHLVGLGVPAHSHEASLGQELARHAAAHNVRTLLYTASTSQDGPKLLHLQRRSAPHPDVIERDIASLAGAGRPAALVVIDPFHRLHTSDDADRLHYPDEAAEAGRRLKQLTMNNHYQRPAILVMAHLAPGAGEHQPLRLNDLGLAAELEYDSDTLVLLRRTAEHSVDVLVAKDRYGPVPLKTTLTW